MRYLMPFTAPIERISYSILFFGLLVRMNFNSVGHWYKAMLSKTISLWNIDLSVSANSLHLWVCHQHPHVDWGVRINHLSHHKSFFSLTFYLRVPFSQISSFWSLTYGWLYNLGKFLKEEIVSVHFLLYYYFA